MAIVGKFEVVIRVGGKVAQEYDGYDKKPPQQGTMPSEELRQLEARNYIEAEEDAFFTIECGILPAYDFGIADCVVFEATVDGQWLTEYILDRNSYSECKGSSVMIDGLSCYEGEEWSSRRFKFEEFVGLETEDHEWIERDKKIGYGTIRVTAWPSSGFVVPPKPLFQHDTKADIAKKAISNQNINIRTSLGEAMKIDPEATWNATEIGSRPEATFVFHYRSRSIIERPIPLEARPIEGLDLSQARELLQMYKARLVEAEAEPNIKQEPITEADLDELDNGRNKRPRLINLDEHSDIEEIPPPKHIEVREGSVHDEIL